MDSSAMTDHEINIFEILRDTVESDHYGVAGVTPEDLYKSVMGIGEGLIPIDDKDKATIRQMISDNTSNNIDGDKVFTQLFNAQGPLVLSKNFLPIIKVIVCHDGSATVSDIISELPLFLPSDDLPQGYAMAGHYLRLIETMLDRGYLTSVANGLKVSLAEGLIYDA